MAKFLIEVESNAKTAKDVVDEINSHVDASTGDRPVWDDGSKFLDLGLTPKAGPFSIVYEADGTIFNCGPWDTEAEAMAYAKANNYNGPGGESEFDINDQRVYLLHPDHRLEELSISDLVPENEVEVEGGVFTFETDDGTIRYTDNHGNSEGVWRPGEAEYDTYKAQYFPDNRVVQEDEDEDDEDDGE